jgi:NADH-quinone oxidoreductase subunit C
MPDETQQEGSGEESPAAGGEAKAEGEAGAKPERPARHGKEAAPTRKPPEPGGIAGLIAQALPDVKLEAYQGITDVIVEVAREDVPNVMPVLRDDPRLDLKFLRCLFGVDQQEEGFEIVYQLMSLEKRQEVVVKTRLPRDDASVATVTPVWNAANWHERETRDMFGIEFEGHPHLVPLLLPEDMTDHFPLRKDSPLAEIEEWQADFLGEGAGGDDEEIEE